MRCVPLHQHSYPQLNNSLINSIQISKLFQQWHELHIRWTSSRPYKSTPPFTSRISPGLHVFFTPLSDTSEDALCSVIRFLVPPWANLDPKCASTSTSSTKMPILSERFSMSTTSQYYSYIGSINQMKHEFWEIICNPKVFEIGDRCREAVTDFFESDYIDIDYDTISRSVVLTAGRAQATEGDKPWVETIDLPTKDATVEIGVLTLEGNADPEDIQFGGFLTVLGQDEKPSTPFHLATLSPQRNNETLTTNRTHTVPNPNPPLPPSPGLGESNSTTQTPPPNIQHLFQSTNRPPSNTNPHIPCARSHAPRPLL
jgi:hypothetical protein